MCSITPKGLFNCNFSLRAMAILMATLFSDTMLRFGGPTYVAACRFRNELDNWIQSTSFGQAHPLDPYCGMTMWPLPNDSKCFSKSRSEFLPSHRMRSLPFPLINFESVFRLWPIPGFWKTSIHRGWDMLGPQSFRKRRRRTGIGWQMPSRRSVTEPAAWCCRWMYQDWAARRSLKSDTHFKHQNISKQCLQTVGNHYWSKRHTPF